MTASTEALEAFNTAYRAMLDAARRLEAALTADVAAGITSDRARVDQRDIVLIQHLVATQYGLTPFDLLSQARPGHIAQPRQVAMTLCAILTNHNLKTLGAAFNRAHSTILHAKRAVANLCATDAAFLRHYNIVHALAVDALAAHYGTPGGPTNLP